MSEDDLGALDDHALAAHLAREAGRILVALREEMVSAGTTRWALKNAGDMAAHEWLTEQLAALRPGDCVLSEEGADDRARLSAERVWIVDPLDGTNEFGEGRADWAVHVALWERGDLAAGAVSLPALDRVLATAPAPTLAARRDGPPRLITSRSHAPYSAVLVARGLGCDAFTLGSAGAKAMSVVLDEADIYVHDGGMYEWDSAAPVAVARAAGLHTSRIDGTPFVYNHHDPYLPDLLICRPEFAGPVLECLWGKRP